jgi:hypothetical protein
MSGIIKSAIYILHFSSLIMQWDMDTALLLVSLTVTAILSEYFSNRVVDHCFNAAPTMNQSP